MTTARLGVLNAIDYEPTEEDYIGFRDALGRWACRWTAEIAAPIAANARDLFANRAVRALVMRWDDLEAKGRDFKLRDFAMVADAGRADPDALARNTWEREAGELSQALYYLLVQEWD